MPYDPDDPGIPTLTTRVKPAAAGPKRYDATAAGPPWDETPAVLRTRSAAQAAGAPPRPAPGSDSPQGRRAAETALEAVLEAEIERAVARALDDAIDEVRARLEREIPALVKRALERTRQDP